MSSINDSRDDLINRWEQSQIIGEIVSDSASLQANVDDTHQINTAQSQRESTGTFRSQISALCGYLPGASIPLNLRFKNA